MENRRHIRPTAKPIVKNQVRESAIGSIGNIPQTPQPAPQAVPLNTSPVPPKQATAMGRPTLPPKAQPRPPARPNPTPSPAVNVNHISPM